MFKLIYSINMHTFVYQFERSLILFIMNEIILMFGDPIARIQFLWTRGGWFALVPSSTTKPNKTFILNLVG